MLDFITDHEPTIRLSFFFGSLALVALWEIASPRRKLTAPKAWRWANNLGVTFLNSFILRILFPVLAAGMALIAEEKGWGILNMIDLPLWPAVILAIVFQDLVIYAQHILFHHVPIFWRLHKVHHADVDYDVTTGARFHPLEICLSMVIKLCVVLILGPPVVAVILFEIILSTMAMFNHANARLPLKVDALLRFFVVTPDMHRVHHSIQRPEYNRNFGFNLAVWDRLFGTYKSSPDAGHEGMTIGLPEYQDSRKQSALWILMLPFRSS